MTKVVCDRCQKEIDTHREKSFDIVDAKVRNNEPTGFNERKLREKNYCETCWEKIVKYLYE